MHTATAIAHPNIAFIKYWGNRDARLRLPANGSISMNLGSLHTRTRVTFSASLPDDRLILNHKLLTGPALARVQVLLNRVRELSGLSLRAEVVSENNFPQGAGIASSASAFAALALAASAAADLRLDEPALSRLARLGSGSACRSVPGGFVEWDKGTDDEDSFAHTIAPPGHWALADCVAIISDAHKKTGSSRGHELAPTSPLQAARVADAPRRLVLCRRAILERDFEALAEVAELDSNLMHAVMMTSSPPLFYWAPTTLALMQAVQQWRAQGIPVFYTVDAGPNVHLICTLEECARIASLLREFPGVRQVLTSPVGGPARYI